VRLECPFTAADVQRADRTHVTPRIYANATFEGVRALRVFAELHVKPLLQGLLTTTLRERAVVGLYYRLSAHVATSLRLDGTVHFQSIAATARAAFELALDLALLAADPSNESVDRLIAFTRVERYRVARRLVDFYATRPLPPGLNIQAQRQLCADPKETSEVQALVFQYWGRTKRGDPKSPKHWSRFPEARGRARHVGQDWEERYVRHYSMLSRHVHSGLVGVTGLSADMFDVFVSESHRLVQDSSLVAYDIVGAELQLSRAMERWREKLEFLKNVSGMALVDLRLRELGEPSRLSYLEPNEQNVV
jgi:Family of unknown function (DUF5677)